MKRAQALQQLSREHNHALLLARTARRAAASGDAAAVARGWASLAEAFATGMAAHFDTEERVTKLTSNSDRDPGMTVVGRLFPTPQPPLAHNKYI